jgi:hypothetical protein
MTKKSQKIQIVQEILSFQKKYDVAEIKIDEVKVWPLILSELKFYTNKPDDITTGRVSIMRAILKEFMGWIGMLRQMYNDRKKSRMTTKDADYVFLTQPTRREKLDKYFFDRITDPFYIALENAGYKLRVMEWSFDNKFKTPRYNPSEFIQFSIYRGFFLSLFRSRRTYELELLYTPEFKDILETLNVNIEQFIKTIKRNTRLITSLRQMFYKKMKTSKAKVAFFFPYYGIVSFAFNLACKDLGIKTTEIQHAYVGDNKVTENGYYEISEVYDLLPDAIWCWGDRDKNRVEKWSACNKKRPIAYRGGNLWLNFWMYPEINNNIFYKSSEMQNNSRNRNSKTIILVTLSPYFNIPDWFPEVINKTSNSFDWLLRFHPHTEKSNLSRYRKVFNRVSQNNFSLANKSILPYLLKIAHLHVTVDSSTVAEAKAFNLQSIILGEYGVVKFKKIIEEGQAFAVFDRFEFMEQISKLYSKSAQKKHLEKQFPKSNKELVLNFLNTIDSI